MDLQRQEFCIDKKKSPNSLHIVQDNACGSANGDIEQVISKMLVKE